MIRQNRIFKMFALLLVLAMALPGVAMGEEAALMYSVEVSDVKINAMGMEIDLSPLALALEAGLSEADKTYVGKAILRTSDVNAHGLAVNVGKSDLYIAGSGMTDVFKLTFEQLAEEMDIEFDPSMAEMLPEKLEIPDEYFNLKTLSDMFAGMTKDQEELDKQMQEKVEAIVAKYFNEESINVIDESTSFEFFGGQATGRHYTLTLTSEQMKEYMREFIELIYGPQGVMAETMGPMYQTYDKMYGEMIKQASDEMGIEADSMVQFLQEVMDMISYPEGVAVEVWEVDENNAVVDISFTMQMTPPAQGGEDASAVVSAAQIKMQMRNANSDYPDMDVTYTQDMTVDGEQAQVVLALSALYDPSAAIPEYAVTLNMDATAEEQTINIMDMTMKVREQKPTDAAPGQYGIDMTMQMGPFAQDDEDVLNLAFNMDATHQPSDAEGNETGSAKGKMTVAVPNEESVDAEFEGSFAQRPAEDGKDGMLTFEGKLDITADGEKAQVAVSYDGTRTKDAHGVQTKGKVALSAAVENQMQGTIEAQLATGVKPIAATDLIAGPNAVNPYEMTDEQEERLEMEGQSWMMSIYSDLMRVPGLQAFFSPSQDEGMYEEGGDGLEEWEGLEDLEEYFEENPELIDSTHPA